MTGVDAIGQIREALRQAVVDLRRQCEFSDYAPGDENRYEQAVEALALLDGAVVLSAEEAADVRSSIEWLIEHGGNPSRPVASVSPQKALALLGERR